MLCKVIRPNVSNEKVSSLARPVTLALGLVTVLIALFPPNALEWIVYFAIAGLESAFSCLYCWVCTGVEVMFKVL